MIAYNLELGLVNPLAVQELHLVVRGLRELPREILQFKNLRSLNLRGNRLTSLPPFLAELPSLETLILADNPLKEWPVGEWLAHLKVLDLQNTQLWLKATSLQRYRHLRVLRMKNLETRMALPDLALPETLEELFVPSMGWKQLPDELQNLLKLKVLDFSSNQISRWPSGLIHHPQISRIIGADNRLVSLPPGLQLPKLVHLDLHRNRIKELGPFWKASPLLKQVLLEKNQIVRFPAFSENHPSLRVLDIRKNRLEVFPENIHHAKMLDTLRLSGNRIKSLPPAAFSIARLDTLLLDKNQLGHVQGNWSDLSTLRILDIAQNGLSKIPAELFQLPKLQSLTLVGNPCEPSAKDLLLSPALTKVRARKSTRKILEFTEKLRGQKITNDLRLHLWELKNGGVPSLSWPLIKAGLAFPDLALQNNLRLALQHHDGAMKLEPGMQLLPVGNTGFLSEDWDRYQSLISISKQWKPGLAGLVLGKGKIKSEQLPPEPLPIIWPQQLQAWLDRQMPPAAISSNQLMKLEGLLQSRVPADVELAFGILRNVGLPAMLKPAFQQSMLQQQGSSLGRRLRSFGYRYGLVHE